MESNHDSLLTFDSDLIIRVDTKGRYTFVNDAYCTKAGKSRTELLGKTFIPQVYPDDVPKVLELMKKLSRPPYRGSCVHRSWTPTGWRHFQWTGVALKDESGKIIELQGIGRDVTEEKLADAGLRQQAAELARRNEELEQFAYAASHDLKEPARMVSTFLQLLTKKHGESLNEEGKQYVQYAIEGSSRMLQLIEDLLAYSHITSAELIRTKVDVSKVIEAARKNLSLCIQESGAEITYDELPDVYGNFGMLVHVFQNLIDNSIKYRRQKMPQISVRCLSSENGAIHFAVSDNGQGFDDRYAERIFRLFQRLHTRTTHTGNGIGLTVVKRIIERHGGRIWAESRENEGATFHFTLPSIPIETFSSDADEIVQKLKEVMN